MMMEIEEPLHFSSKDEEIRYWMDIANKMYQRKIDMERELEEFQENSHYLEKELETSCELTDELNRELKRSNVKLKVDNANLRDRLSDQMLTSAKLVTEIRELKIHMEELARKNRKLEQKNDNLEQMNREIKVSEEQKEMLCNELLEKVALLETELEEIVEMQKIIRQLNEENADLKKRVEFDSQEHHSFTNSLYNSSRNSYSFFQTSIRSDGCKSVNDCSSMDSNQTIQTLSNHPAGYVKELVKKIDHVERARKCCSMPDGESIKKLNLESPFFDVNPDEKENFTTTVLQLNDLNEESLENSNMRLSTPLPASAACQTKLSRSNSPDEEFLSSDAKKKQNIINFFKRFRSSTSRKRKK